MYKFSKTEQSHFESAFPVKGQYLGTFVVGSLDKRRYQAAFNLVNKGFAQFEGYEKPKTELTANFRLTDKGLDLKNKVMDLMGSQSPRMPKI